MYNTEKTMFDRAESTRTKPSTERHTVQKAFASSKSQLTEFISWRVDDGMTFYRTRLKCNCTHGHSTREGAIIIDQDDNRVTEYLIKCKLCYKIQQLEGVDVEQINAFFERFGLWGKFNEFMEYEQSK